MKISIEVPDSQGKRLQDVAGRLNIQPEELVSAAVRDLLAQAESDFENVATKVLDKNRELYKRLA